MVVEKRRGTGRLKAHGPLFLCVSWESDRVELSSKWSSEEWWGSKVVCLLFPRFLPLRLFCTMPLTRSVSVSVFFFFFLFVSVCTWSLPLFSWRGNEEGCGTANAGQVGAERHGRAWIVCRKRAPPKQKRKDYVGTSLSRMHIVFFHFCAICHL